jgi:hypothetical protein
MRGARPCRPRALREMPGLRIMSDGDRIEIYKEVGLPRDVAEPLQTAVHVRHPRHRPHPHGHGIRRHDRGRASVFDRGRPVPRAQRLAVQPQRAAPQAARDGVRIESENDTEVGAAYLTWKMQQGATLGEALESALTDLDGFFTFVVGTKDGFGVVRDPIACKPAVMAETDQYVAFGSEYRALVNLPGDRRRPRLGTRARHRLFLDPLTCPSTTSKPTVARPERGASRAGRDHAQRAVGGREPKGSHAIAVGLDAPLDVTVKGSTGYYCGGMNKQATIRVAGSVGPGVAENMMSGTVIVEGDASQYAGATGHGGLLVIKGNASSRCGISMKGIDIVVHGNIGHMSAFMAQAGNLVVCGDAGEALGDSLYEARLFVRGEVKSLGADCVEKEMRPEHLELLADLLEPRRMRCEAGGVPPLRLGPQALQFPHRQRLLREEMDRHEQRHPPHRADPVGDVFQRRQRRDPARGGDRHLRHPRRRREAPGAAFRRPAVSGGLDLAATRWKATARPAVPKSPSARASRRTRSSWTSPSPSPA